MERFSTNLSTQTKPLHTEPQFKLLFLPGKEMKKHRIFFYLMSHHFLWELRLLVTLWLTLLTETPLSLLNNHKHLPLTSTINQACSSEFSKVKERWLRITIFLESLISKEFPQLLKEYHKLKSHLMLMLMVFLMFQLLIRELGNKIKLPSPTTREDLQRMKLNRWLPMLRNSRMKINL